MKTKSLGWALAVVLSLTGIGGVRAQGGDASASGVVSGVASTGAASSAKELRLANRRLAKSVRSRLAKIKGVDVTFIVVIAKEGSITLAGSVPDADQIEPAVAAARGVPGVNAVNNALKVKTVGQ